MQAGQAQAYENMSTPPLIDQTKKDPKLVVTQQLATSPYNIQLNTNVPPFNNQKARDAIYYATDSEAIRSKLFQNRYPSTQSFTGEGGKFFMPTIPGYKTYDLAKAKALVQELGGMSIDLGTIKVLVATQVIQALASQWEQAGIKTKLHSYDLAPLIQAFGRSGSPCCRRRGPTTRPRASAWRSATPRCRRSAGSRTRSSTA